MRRTASASPYERQYGFSRAVRVGNRILVSGTAPVEPDGSSTPGDAAAQARRCLAVILEAIAELGGTASDVVRTRMFITDPADADAIGAVRKGLPSGPPDGDDGRRLGAPAVRMAGRNRDRGVGPG